MNICVDRKNVIKIYFSRILKNV